MTLIWEGGAGGVVGEGGGGPSLLTGCHAVPIAEHCKMSCLATRVTVTTGCPFSGASRHRPIAGARRHSLIRLLFECGPGTARWLRIVLLAANLRPLSNPRCPLSSTCSSSSSSARLARTRRADSRLAMRLRGEREERGRWGRSGRLLPNLQAECLHGAEPAWLTRQDTGGNHAGPCRRLLHTSMHPRQRPATAWACIAWHLRGRAASVGGGPRTA